MPMWAVGRRRLPCLMSGRSRSALPRPAGRGLRHDRSLPLAEMEWPDKVTAAALPPHCWLMKTINSIGGTCRDPVGLCLPVIK